MRPKQRGILICSAGLPGSGKGVIGEAARKMGIPVIVMGDIVRREAVKMGLKPNNKGTAKVMVEYRERFGREVFAKITMDEVGKLKSNLVLIDGVRNPEELEYFREMGWNVFVIAVLASPKERFRRLRGRGRVDDIQNYEDFIRRDERELGIGLGKVLLHADKFLVNEGKTREEAVEEALRIIRDILEEESFEEKAW